MIIGIKDIEEAFSVPIRRAGQVEENVVITEPTELTPEEVAELEARHEERLLAEEAQTERETEGKGK